MDSAVLAQPLVSTAAPHSGPLPVASEASLCSQISNGVDSVVMQGGRAQQQQQQHALPLLPPPLQGLTPVQLQTHATAYTPGASMEKEEEDEAGQDHNPTNLTNELPLAPPPPPPSTTAPIPPLAPTVTVSLLPPSPDLAVTNTLPPPPPLATVTAAASNNTTQLHTTATGKSRVSPPSLHANEEMLSDSDDEDMDTHHVPPPACPPAPAAALSNSQSSQQSDSQATSAPPTSALPTNAPSVRSESVSPYGEADDDSFASFVAREVHETASLMEEDRSSLSRSPTPFPPLGSSTHSSNDISALMNFIQNVGDGSGLESSSAMIQQFGVTANSPLTAVTLPESSLPAPLDMTALNFPKRSKYAHRAALSAMHPYNRTRGGGASVAKTLDLMKAVLQSSFNMEVKRLCDDYLGIFTMAASNVHSNTGDSVPDPTLKLLVCKMLEEAQNGYVDSKWEFPSGKLPKNDKVSAAKGSPMSTKKSKPEKSEMKYGPAKRVRKAPTERHSDKSGGWRWGMDKRRVDPGKWEPDKLATETDFVLGVNVNKALGHAANRGKVYYLHPELFKYACDGDDKTWLYENKFLPVHGGKAFLMIFTEVEALIETDAYYRDNSDVRIAVKKLQFFHVPVFMIDKMKNFMRSVQGYFAQEASTSSTSIAALESKA